MKLAIITTHPIQYNAPFFRLLQERGNITLKVFYTWGESVLANKFDPGFNKPISWDIPLLEGYEYEFPENTAKEKGSHHFLGIINPGLVKSLEAFDPKALLVFGWSFQSHLKVMRHFKDRRTVIVRGDSSLLDKIPFHKRWARNLFLRWVYRHADYALYAGQNNYAYFKKMGMKDRQLIYGPHAIDNNRFSDSGNLQEDEALSQRRDLSIPADAVVFLFAGKLEHKKAPDLLLQSFVSAGLQNAYLVIIGNGVQESLLKKKYAQYANIRFLDFQNQSRMPMIYRLADVFVLPSRGPDETWGLAVNEAMAAGKAILVSDRCGCAADLVQPGINGYIVKAGDEQDLREKLQILVADKNVLRTMGEASKKMITDFSYDKIADALEKLLLNHT